MMSEFKRLLINKMKLLEWQKIAGKFPATDVQCKNIDWDHNETVMSKINTCKQKETEPPDQYMCRLTEVFNIHSGIDQPANLGDVAGNIGDPPNSTNCFLNGLKPEIATVVKN